MSARMGLLAYLSLKLDAIKAHALIKEHRAEVLREAADAIDSGNTFPEPVRGGASWAARMLRRMADEVVEEKATPEGEATPTTTGWTHVDGFPVHCPHCHTTQSHCNACGTDMYDQPTEGAS